MLLWQRSRQLPRCVLVVSRRSAGSTEIAREGSVFDCKEEKYNSFLMSKRIRQPACYLQDDGWNRVTSFFIAMETQQAECTELPPKLCGFSWHHLQTGQGAMPAGLTIGHNGALHTSSDEGEIQSTCHHSAVMLPSMPELAHYGFSTSFRPQFSRLFWSI